MINVTTIGLTMLVMTTGLSLAESAPVGAPSVGDIELIRSLSQAGAAPVTNHPLTVAAPPLTQLQYVTSWLGNTFGNGKDWVQKDGNALAVGADGACYVTARWDESGKGIGIYKNGGCAGQMQGVSAGGGAAAVDERYACFSTAGQVKGSTGTNELTHGISRFHLDGTPAPWDDGLVTSRGGMKNFLPIGPQWLAGAVLHGGELFVGDPATDTIRVFNRETMQEKRRFPCEHPFRMTVDQQGLLWVIRRENSNWQGLPTEIVKYTLTGKPTGVAITGTNAAGATALAVDPAGHLLVAGPNSQVLKFAIAKGTPHVVETLGVKDGVYAGAPGAMAPDKLLGLWGVGADAAGNIYTLGSSPATGGCVDLRKFSPQGRQLWQLVSTQFTDTAGVDPASDGADVYTRDKHFVMDYRQPPGQQWTWQGFTLDSRLDDGRVEPRMSRSMFTWASPMVRRLDGRLYLFERPGYYLGIFRHGPGELFVPSGLIDLTALWQKKITDTNHVHFYTWPEQQNKLARWIWRDRTGDGKIQADEFESRPDLVEAIEAVADSWVDTRGDIWLCGGGKSGRCLWHLPLQGFDAQQNPIYRLADLVPLKLPDEFLNKDGVNYYGARRLIYDAETDVMYLAGETKEHTNKKLHWGAIGTEVIRYDDWSKPMRRVRWRIALPTEPKNADFFFNSLTVAGQRLFCIVRFKSTIYTYDTETGQPVGLITPGPEVGGASGWCDMANGIQAFRRQNGEILLFAEDDYRERIILYRIPPPEKMPNKN